MTSTSFIHLRERDGRVEVGGQKTFFAGRKVVRRDGGLDGIYAGWEWDGQRLTVTNCRYGAYQLFYFCRDGEIALSPSLTKLIELGAPREIDEPALAVFLRLHWFVGEDTPFLGIRCIPPDANLRWSDGKLEVSGKLSIVDPQSMSRDEAIDRYLQCFREAVEDRAPNGHFAVPLSGGQDSRHILFELNRLGLRPEFCVTMRHFPPRADEDARIAGLLAEAIDAQHVVLDYTKSRLEAERRKNIETNFLAHEHAWSIPLADYLRDRVDLVYDGIGGDILSAGLYNDETKTRRFREGKLTELAHDYLDLFGGSEAGLDRLLKPRWRHRFRRDAAVERLVRELERHREAANPVASFLFWNRLRRCLSTYTFGIIADGFPLDAHCPYLDHRIYDLLSSLPPEISLDKTMHAKAISRAFPEFDQIPFEDKATVRPESGADRALQRRFARDLLRFALSSWSSRFVDRLFVVPRLAVGSMSRNPSRIDWVKPGIVSHLLQLESLAKL